MYNKETGMYEGYIYQIYNPFNMKSYIGQTTRTIQGRFSAHKSASKNGIEDSYFLYTDARNFGWDIFDVYEVEKIECDTIDGLRGLLNTKEIYYIDNYNSLYPNGYNISPGGNARNIHCYVKVYQFDLNKILIAEYLSMVEASIKTGILITKISDCCNGRTVTAGDFYWSKYPYLPDNIEQYRHKKRVVQYTLDGKLVGVFDSTIQAGYSFTSDDKKAQSISANISRCANGNAKTAHKYMWKKFEDVVDSDGNVLEKLPKSDIVDSIFQCRPVSQYDKNGKYICTFPSIIEASIATQINRSCISACLAGRQKTAGGYIWKDALEE
jgi:hypothetical protein